MIILCPLSLMPKPKVMSLIQTLFIKTNPRSSRPEVFCKKGVLGNLTKFTGKHMCQGLFFKKAVGIRP